MPSSTIQCSGCDYEKLDLCAPISLVYRSEDGREATIPKSVGWCYSCDEYVYIENFQKSTLMGIQSVWKMHDGLSSDAEKLQMLIDYSDSRQSKMSCLECWSKETVPLEIDTTEIEELETEKRRLSPKWKKIELGLNKKPLMEFATPRQRRVLEEGLYGNTEAQRQFYLLKVKETRSFVISDQEEKFFKHVDDALRRAETHQKFRDFNHKCGGDLLNINDGAIRANIFPKQFVLDLEGNLIMERSADWH